MEKKKTQRIIGILVLIALVIMIAPLLLGKNNGPVAEATDIKAPPIPDQPKKTSLADNAQSDISIAPAETTAPAPTTATAAAPTPTTTTVSTPATTSTTAVIPAPTMAAPTTPAPTSADPNTATNPTTPVSAPESKIDTVTPEKTNANGNETPGSIIYEHPKETNQINQPTDSLMTKTNEPGQEADASIKATPDVKKEIAAPTIKQELHPPHQVKPAVVNEKSQKNKIKSIMAKNKNVNAAEHTTKLKTAWAIQMGSFKVKQNAINFVNKLRAAGYKAFTRDIKTANGNKITGVYIGPETKQASAIKLAFDVNHHFNSKGYVIAYQPFDI